MFFFISCYKSVDSFDNIFSRSLEAIGNKGDLLLVISTSGMSKNILEVLKKATHWIFHDQKLAMQNLIKKFSSSARD